MHITHALIAFAVWLAFADRWVGGGAPKLLRKEIYAAAPITGVLLALIYWRWFNEIDSSLELAVAMYGNIEQTKATMTAFVGLTGFAAYYGTRDPKWTIFGGDLDPELHQFWPTVERHALALLFLVPLALMGANLKTLAIAAVLLFAYAIWAGLLARLININRDKGIGSNYEPWRGLGLGIALALSIAVLAVQVATQ